MRWPLVVLLAGCPAGDFDSDAPTPACPVDAPAWGEAAERMLPGTDGLGCHVADGRARTPLTAAGTVFTGATCPAPVVGATVHLVDAEGSTVDATTNDVGNFVIIDALVPPFDVTISASEGTVTMTGASGGCGGCHVVDGVGYVHLP